MIERISPMLRPLSAGLEAASRLPAGAASNESDVLKSRAAERVVASHGPAICVGVDGHARRTVRRSGPRRPMIDSNCVNKEAQTMHLRTVVVTAALVFGCCAGWPAVASKTEKNLQLVNLHDLESTVAIGDYFLKQQSLLAVRAYLARVGVEQNLGKDWNPSNAYWKQAEDVLVTELARQARREFSNLEWLSEEWTGLNDRDLSEADIDTLLRHFGTEIGRKQLMIVDHSVAFHVMASLSMAGKIEGNLAGSEAERKHMQDLYNAEDDAMRFDPNTSPEGTQFALSPIGKKYFTNVVLKISGLITRRLYALGREMPERVDASSPEVQAAVAAYRRSRSG